MAKGHPSRGPAVTVGTVKWRNGRKVKKHTSVETGDPHLLATRSASSAPVPPSRVPRQPDAHGIDPRPPSDYPVHQADAFFPSSDGDNMGNFGDEDEGLHDDQVESNQPDIVHIVNCGDAPSKRKRIRESAFEAWLPYREDTLQELFRLDGLGCRDSEISCSNCQTVIPSTDPIIRCLSCITSPIQCKACTVAKHLHSPFHCIEVWNGEYWERDELCRFGLTVQLGHNGATDHCQSPGREDTLTVIDVSGHHHVTFRFCRCSFDLATREERNQLINARLFPASFKYPKTAFTFQLLDLITVMTERGKSSVYDFHLALRFLTDACELSALPRRYLELGATVRRYRDMMMHKRAGRGHVPDGIATTPVGELAVLSPALPYPERNMPSDWRTRFHDKPHLKAIYPCIDGNFRLKEKDKPSRNDPGLIAGGGFFVPDALLAKEVDRIQKDSTQKQSHKMSTCESSFSAVERAESRHNQGFAVTGVVAVIDARYGFLLPSGVCDLHKGERFVYSDLAYLSALKRFSLEDSFTSYDIACRWSIHCEQRWVAFPSGVHGIVTEMKIRFAVPKFHLPAHGPICWTVYSFNFIIGGARTDGEAVERFWSVGNVVCTSTREMGHGMRHDFLEARWNMYNFHKLVDLGSTMSRRLETAVKGHRRHRQEFTDFSTSFSENTIADWTAPVSKESSRSFGDPTHSPDEEEEDADPEDTAEEGGAFPLDLNPEDVVLYLPSHEASVSGSFAPTSLVNKELRLRKGRLEAHLKQLRRLLRVKVAVYLDKAANSVGQKAGTRANTILAEYNCKIENTAVHYREERAATLRLDPTGAWQQRLKDLKKADVRPVSRNESDAEDTLPGTGRAGRGSVWRQGQRTISWIWKMSMQRTDPESNADTTSPVNAEVSQVGEDGSVDAIEASPEEVGDALQVEWAKAYARVNRFAEEEELVLEEMKRVRRYFIWREKWWKDLVPETTDSVIDCGRAAYARKQMGLIRKLDCKFAGLWRATLHGLGMAAEAVDNLE